MESYIREVTEDDIRMIMMQPMDQRTVTAGEPYRKTWMKQNGMTDDDYDSIVAGIYFLL
jgi:hypothetical protein